MPRQIRDRADKMSAMTFLFVCVQDGDANDCPSSRSGPIPLTQSLKFD